MSNATKQQIDQAEQNALLERAVDWMVNLAASNVCAHDNTNGNKLVIKYQ